MSTVVVLDTDFLSVNIPAFLLACKQTEFLGRLEVEEMVLALEREDHYGFRREVRKLLVR